MEFSYWIVEAPGGMLDERPPHLFPLCGLIGLFVKYLVRAKHSWDSHPIMLKLLCSNIILPSLNGQS